MTNYADVIRDLELTCSCTNAGRNGATALRELQAKVQAAQMLLAKWEFRSHDALPSDAMLINRHIRELQAAIDTPSEPT